MTAFWSGGAPAAGQARAAETLMQTTGRRRQHGAWYGEM
jgi:hypothetical protein